MTPSAQGKRLADIVTQNLAFMGLVFGPVSGILMDKCGGIAPILLLNGINLSIIALLCSASNWTLQTAAVTAVNFY